MNRNSMVFLALIVSLLSYIPQASGADNATSTAPMIPVGKPLMPVMMPPSAASGGAGFSGTVVETMNSGGYTYVFVDTGTEKKWAAAPETKVKVGDVVKIPEGAPMPGFHSKTLNRDFEMIYFVGSIGTGNASETGSTGATPAPTPSADTSKPQMPAGHPTMGGANSTGQDIVVTGIQKVDGGMTIAEIYADKANLGGKDVKVRGKVVKFNGGIMGKNWFHLKDGTGEKETSDLTVTTDAVVKVGDTVVVTGKAAVDKDFGAGYKYAIILEEGKVVVE